jgi:hypothetical protein
VFESLTAADRVEVESEAELLAGFLVPDIGTREIQIGESA